MTSHVVTRYNEGQLHHELQQSGTMINAHIRLTNRSELDTEGWISSSSSSSSSSTASLCNKSEPAVVRHRAAQVSNPSCSELVFSTEQDQLTDPGEDLSHLSDATWRNPSQARGTMSSSSGTSTCYSSSAESETGSEGSWSDEEEEEEEEVRMYPNVGGLQDEDNEDLELQGPISFSTGSISESLLADKEAGSGSTSWLDEKLARDLSSIMPSFDFTNTSNLFTDRPMFSSNSSSTSSQKLSYTSSCGEESKNPRHSWAGNLDIIDSNTLQYYSAKHLSKRRRDSFDRTFSVKKRPAATRNKDEVVHLKFESQSCVFDQMKTRIPGLKQLIRTKTQSTDLILEWVPIINLNTSTNSRIHTSFNTFQFLSF